MREMAQFGAGTILASFRAFYPGGSMFLIPMLVSVALTTPAKPFFGGAQPEIEGEGAVPVAAS